jgi:hypothetical protein
VFVWCRNDNELLILYNAAKKIDVDTKRLLGINIQKISLLLQTDPNEYRTRKALEEAGTLVLLEDLNSQGLIKIEKSFGLPDGSHKNEEFIRYSATDKGKILISAFTP